MATGADVRDGRQRVQVGVDAVAHHRDARALAACRRERRDVPAGSSATVAAALEHARVGLGDDVKRFHVRDRYAFCLRAFQDPYATLRSPCRRSSRPDRRTTSCPLAFASWPQRFARTFPTMIHFVCVLKGAFMFLADLVRAMDDRVTLDFIAVSSYGESTNSSGEVRLVKDLDTGLEGRHVVIVEDIVDTGLTLHYLQDILRAVARDRSGPRAC